MPFFLDGNPTQGEISEAVNYLLSNFTQNVSADQGTGQVIGPGGNVQSYLYKYMYIKYATSFDGTVGFSNVPTNATYYGLRNTDDPTESTNPADYIWTKVTPGFGTTYFLYYLTTGGRSIQFQEATSVPNPGWQIDPGTSIDLDLVTNITNTPANFVVIRVANNSAAPTNAEVLAAIGRLPIDGDLCTVNYNSGLYSLTFKYTTGWAIFQKYITGDLIVAQSIVGNNIAANTITAGNIAANTITASQIAANTITAGQIAANTITAGNMNVAQLSAITANMGSITAGELTIGSSPAISGTTMTGTGAHLYSSGNFAFGNSSKNFVFDGSNVYLNGFQNATQQNQTSLSITIGSNIQIAPAFVTTKTSPIQLLLTGSLNLQIYSSIARYVGCTIELLLYDSSMVNFVDRTCFVGMACVPGFGSPAVAGLNVPFAISATPNIPAGTYIPYMKVSGVNWLDSSGTAVSGSTICDFSGTMNIYQAAI